MSDYTCPKCNGDMEFFYEPHYHDIDSPYFEKGALVCEDCQCEIPYEAYGFDSCDEFKSWWSDTYEMIFEEDEDRNDSDDDDEYLDIYTAQENWIGSGKDDDYEFGYSEDELNDLD